MNFPITLYSQLYYPVMMLNPRGFQMPNDTKACGTDFTKSMVILCLTINWVSMAIRSLAILNCILNILSVMSQNFCLTHFLQCDPPVGVSGCGLIAM